MNGQLPDGYMSWIEFYNSLKDKIKGNQYTKIIKFSNWSPVGMVQFEFTVDYIKARCFEEAESYAHYEIHYSTDYYDFNEEFNSHKQKLQYICGFRNPNDGTVKYFQEYRKTNI